MAGPANRRPTSAGTTRRTAPRGKGAPHYVVVEGIDGSGKSELLPKLAAFLRRRGHTVSTFREPSDPFLRAEAVRLSRHDPIAAAACFTVDRVLNRPHLEAALGRGEVVLQDRSFLSNLAYQGVGLDGKGRRALARIQRHVARPPDLVLYLDLPVPTALARLERRGPRDAFEEEQFLRQVRTGFERLYEPRRWRRIDASGPRTQTYAGALRALLAAGL